MSKKRKGDFVSKYEDDAIDLNDIAEWIDSGDVSEMMGAVSAFIDSATKLTEVCANAEIQSGNKILAKDVRRMFMENFSMISSIGMADDD